DRLPDLVLVEPKREGDRVLKLSRPGNLRVVVGEVKLQHRLNLLRVRDDEISSAASRRGSGKVHPYHAGRRCEGLVRSRVARTRRGGGDSPRPGCSSG